MQVKVNLEITTFFFYLHFPYCPNFFWFGVVLEIRKKYSVRKAFLQREWMNKVFKHRLRFNMGVEAERNSGFSEENLLPTRLGSQSKLPR